MAKYKDKLDKALGIGEELSNLDSEDSDEEKKRRFEERKKSIIKIKKDLQKIKENPDEMFIKEQLKELTTSGMIALRTIQEEIELNPTGRDVECMATMMNAITSSLKELKETENDKIKIGQKQQEIDIKKLKSSSENRKLTQNNVFVGSVNELRKAIKDIDVAAIDTEYGEDE